MREGDVKMLIQDAENLLGEIESSYKYSLRSKIVSPYLQIRVKQLMEHLRSVLDYIAADVTETLSEKKIRQKIYFPYGKNKGKFEEYIDRDFPFIRNFPAVYDLFVEMQHHETNSQFLYDFCHILNVNNSRLKAKALLSASGNMPVVYITSWHIGR